MKVLHLTLKKKWFDMIASGEKKEEYREIKPYWASRLTTLPPEFAKRCELQDVREYTNNFDAVVFKNGYAKDAPTITLKCDLIYIGEAKPEWSDNWQGEVFVIKLGEIINPPIK